MLAYVLCANTWPCSLASYATPSSDTNLIINLTVRAVVKERAAVAVSRSQTGVSRTNITVVVPQLWDSLRSLTLLPTVICRSLRVTGLNLPLHVEFCGELIT